MQGWKQGWKLQGAGNSFVIGWIPEQPASSVGELAALLSDPHFGIGSDGALFVSRERDKHGHYPVLMFNPDGSAMGMCGNGVRCLVRFLALEQVLSSECGSVSFQVGKREIRANYRDSGAWVEVDMGRPGFLAGDIPTTASGDLSKVKLHIDGKSYQSALISMGNPHCVIRLECLQGLDIESLGPKIEHDSIFPERTNVEFVEIVDHSRIKMRVWERGVGETLACGTGACAAVVALSQQGFCSREVQVQLPGGELEVKWCQSSDHVFLSGPAVEIARLELTLSGRE